jgi:hypothetical protein
MQLQRVPEGSPILGCGLHDNFLDPLLDQPIRQSSQFVWAGAERAPVKIVFAFDRYIGYHDGQHSLVNINSRYPVTHKVLL